MNMRENWRRSKEVLGAYLRHGAHEIGSVFYGRESAAQHPEYGMAWTKTPGEVADGMRGRDGHNPEQGDAGRSVLDSYLQQEPAREDHERQRELPERERE